MNLDQTVSRVALAGALLFGTMPAMAQDQATEPGQTPASAKVVADAQTALATPDATSEVASPANEMIVVTGSRIQRPNMTSAAPITSITAQDIRAQAPTNIEDVLNRLPQIAPDAQQTY